MFQRTAQNQAELIRATAADYAAARKRQAEVQSERAALVAAPLATNEQVAIMARVLEQNRKRYEAEFDRRLEVMNEPHFDVNDPDCLDSIDPIRIIPAPAHFAWSDAIATIIAPAILAHTEARAKANGCDRSKLTFAKKQAELSRLDTLIVELDNAAQRSLNLWREQTGNLSGYP